MSAILILLVSFVVLFIAYVTYGSWLAKQWGIDPSRKTPANEINDGTDYVPAKAPVLMGHHFASIAGAGPVNGPILASIFGWVPVALWIIIGGIFFGAVQDFSSLYASVRHGGKSIGHVIEVNLGTRGKKLFLGFAWLTLMLILAAFADIAASTFAGFDAEGTRLYANASVASTSILFIMVSVVFGFMVYRRNASLALATIIGVAFIAISMAIGLNMPIFLSRETWLLLLFAYIAVAALVPVWILLQPRDYLNSFLLYGMIFAAFIGIIFTNPTVNLVPFAGFTVGNQYLFPMLFITLACGAISGFHSLVSSGTTSKQLDNEKDCKLIGYGGMLIESGLAIVALIAVGALVAADGTRPAGTPPVIFANGIASFLGTLGVPHEISFTLITLAVSAFVLTTLDTATRLSRYMFQEFFVPEGADRNNLTGAAKLFSNPYVATGISIVVAGVLTVGGYQNIWPLFGAANQLLAALALLTASIWLGNIGKNNRMFMLPMLFMLGVTLTSLGITSWRNFNLLTGGAGLIYREGLQIVIAIVLFVLAMVLTVEGIGKLFSKKSV